MGTRIKSVLLLAIVGAGLCGCNGEAPDFAKPVHTPADLAARGKAFAKEVVKVTDGVYVAIGYGLANSIMVEGDDGVIIIDTMGSLEAGRAVRAAFRKVVDKPVRAIIYTHNHADHVFGAQAFVDAGVEPAVYAQARTMDSVYRIVTEFRPVISRRAQRMFGTHLDAEALVNEGIGPALGIGPDSTLSILPPTRTFTDTLTDTVAGVRFKLVHAPGETNDEIFVWFPDKRVLAPGDNIYKAFPNLYSIRGTPYRSPKAWADSLDMMRALDVEYLVPSHTRPLTGAKKIHETLTDYRDAIRYVYDQSVRAINRGMTPDELAQAVKLPPHLANSPYLQELYGTVEWSARSVFTGNLGWFDGNPTHLHPLAPRREAERMAELAGGEAALKRALHQAVADGEYQWALQLSDYARRLQPDDTDVRADRIEALTALGEAASNPNARHYYLTSALEQKGLKIEPLNNADDALLDQLPLARFFAALPVNLDARAALNVDRKVGISFTDSDAAYTIWVRHGVAEIRQGLMDDLDIHVAVNSLVWKQMLARKRNSALAIAKDFDYRKGGRVGFAKFMKLFQPSG